jgi:hypothetical protein
VISTGQTMVMSQAPGGNGYQVVRGRAAADLAGGRSIVRFSLARGSQAREVYLGWEPPKREPAREAGRGAGAALGAARAFEPQLYSAVLPDGSLVLSDSTAYALKVIGPDGGVRGVFRRPLRPRPVTAAMQRAERERRLAELTSGGARLMMDRGGGAGPSAQQIEQMVRENLEALQFYPELPVVAGLAAGWTGKIWVERTPASGNGNGPVDVLGTTGEYLGTIGPEGPQIPDAFGPNGLVAYVERDPLDVVSITVRRLPPELR